MATTLTSWSLLIWRTLKEDGIDPKPFFNQAGLDPSLLGDGNARYPLMKTYKLWQSLESLDDPFIGIKVGQNWCSTSFHALGFSWLASTTLLDAFSRLCRYGKLVNNAFNSEIRKENQHYILAATFEDEEKHIHTFSADAIHSALLKMSRAICGENFSPLEVHFRRKPNLATQKLATMFRCEIKYNCAAAHWLIDRYEMEKSLPGGNPELAHFNENLAQKALNRVIKSDIGMQVKLLVSENLPTGEIDEERIADKLGMSIRSLQRKLNAEDLSFSAIVNQVRHDLAIHYIEQKHISINEISYLLGYAEQASFTRAFKKWTGKSPTTFRKEHTELLAS